MRTYNAATLLLLFSVVFFGGPAFAEKADREKPMNVEADALRHDDLAQTSVFTGNVVLTKGTILIRGTRLEVRQDADGYIGREYTENGQPFWEKHHPVSINPPL